MAESIERRLADLGIVLPKAAAPIANYVPFVRTGGLLFIAAQLPVKDGKVAFTGRLGEGVSLEEGQAAARLCAINLIAQARAALSDLDRVRRVVRLGGFVASAADFTDQPKVINGASDLMVEIFGEAGRHARAAVGVNVLPLGAAVEIDAVFEVA
ncbi:MAG TPA: RidA family protein [Alphaproteobacteria bacterium]|jgi:enamine deaminase RidA (YjgF/YER057c/UK114 family)